MKSQPKYLSAPSMLLLMAGLCILVATFATSDERTRPLVVNTLMLAAGACAIALPLGTILAFLLVRTDMPGRRIGLLLTASMLFIPLYLYAAGWDAGWGKQGWYTALTGRLDAQLLAGWRAAILIHGAASTAWVVLIVGLGLQTSEAELEEKALLDGSMGQVFTHITLRRASTSMLAAGLWVMTTTACEITVTDMYQIRTYAEEIYLGFALGDDFLQLGYSALPGIFLFGGLAMVSLFVVSQMAPRENFATMKQPWIFRLGAARWPAAALAAMLLLFLVAVPLGNLCYKAGLIVEQIDGQRVRHWDAMKFFEIVTSTPLKFEKEFRSSFALALLTSGITLAAAVPLAWVARRGGRRAAVPFFIIAACLAAPGPLVGIILIWLFDWPNAGMLTWIYDRTLLTPALGAMVRGLPLALMIAWYGFHSLADETFESAASEGAGSLTRFWKIALPQRFAILAVAWLAGFATAMGDLACSILVLPPGAETVSKRVFGLIHAGVDDQVAGLCLINVILFTAITAIALRLLWTRPTE